MMLELSSGDVRIRRSHLLEMMGGCRVATTGSASVHHPVAPFSQERSCGLSATREVAVRISAIKVTNFKGIRRAELTQLDTQPYVALTGQNGVGKTTIIEAVALLVRLAAPEPQPYLVRLGEDAAEIDVAFTLTDGEFQQVDRYHRATYGQPVEPCAEYRRMARIDKAGNVTYSGSPVATAIFDTGFRRDRAFPSVAVVHNQRNQTSRLGMPHLGIGHIGGVGKLETQFENPGQGSQLTSNLAALDYWSCLETRRRKSPRDDYGDLAQVFEDVTGKRLLRPVPVGYDGTRIEVELRDGNRHDLGGLSSGESGFLGLLCLLYWSAGDGGVLLLDEPELHLHPTLQTALLRTIGRLAPRAQTIIVTHAVKLVASARPAQVYQIMHHGADQARRAADAWSQGGVISDMGIEQADLLGKAGHLVVEGETDEHRLARLFPDEMEHIHVTKAGDSKQVLAHHRHLAEAPASLPWLCLIDRDLMSDNDIRQHRRDYPHLYIWTRRALESMLLDPTLLSAVFTSVGSPLTPDEAATRLRDAADHVVRDVVTAMLHAALDRDHPKPRLARHGGDAAIQKFYLDNAQVDQAKAEAVPTIRARLEAAVTARWEHERFVLADPKKVLGQLVTTGSPFRTTRDLTNALTAHAAQNPNVRPAGLEDFRQHLVMVINGQHPYGPRL